MTRAGGTCSSGSPAWVDRGPAGWRGHPGAGTGCRPAAVRDRLPGAPRCLGTDPPRGVHRGRRWRQRSDRCGSPGHREPGGGQPWQRRRPPRSRLLREPDPTQTVLTVRPGQRGHKDLDGIHVHRAGLPRWHVSEANGLPVTTVARTLVDLTRALSLRDGVVAMDAARHSGRVRLEQLEEVLADCRGWPWIRRAASAVKLTDPAAESALESLSRMFFSAHDIPAPVTQFVVRSGQLFIARTTSGGRSRGSPVKPTDSESTPHLPTCTPRSYGRSGSRHWASGSSAGPGTTSGNRRRPGLRRLGSELLSAGPLEPAAAAHLAAGIHLCLPQATTRRTVHRRVGARGRQSGHGTADPGSRRGTQTDAAEN